MIETLPVGVYLVSITDQAVTLSYQELKERLVEAMQRAGGVR
jgi:hypothetical protein